MRGRDAVISGKDKMKGVKLKVISGFRSQNKSRLEGQILQKTQGAQRLRLAVYGICKPFDAIVRKIIMEFHFCGFISEFFLKSCIYIFWRSRA